MKALSSNRPRKAIILAGGEEISPRSLLIIKGKPLLEWNIELLKNHGVKEIMLCIGKNGQKIRDYFGADELKNIDLDDMYEFHKDGNKTCTIALTTVDDPSKFGAALLNGNRIVTFIEKPLKENSPSKLVNAGLYIIEPEVLKYIPEGFAMLEQDVFPKLAKADKLFGYIFPGQWFSTKTEQSFDKAQKEWDGFS